MKRPLVFIVCFFNLGIVAESIFRIDFGIIYALGACLLLCAGLTQRQTWSTIVFAALIAVLGMVVWRNSRTLPASDIASINFIDPECDYAVKGWVESDPEYTDAKTSFVLRVEEIAGKRLKMKCNGRILAIIRGEKQLFYGKELVLEGRLHQPFGRYLKEQGIFFIMQVPSSGLATVLDGTKGNWALRHIHRLKSRIKAAFAQRLSPVSGSVIGAMVLGEQKDVPAAIYRSMMKTGTVHILVVSGFNVGIVLFLCVLFLKLLRIPRKARFFFCVPLLIAYCLLTGSSDPVVRATVMAIVFLSAYMVKRQADIYNSCAVAALIILVLNPDEFFNIGFQLSFSSVLAIAYLYPRFRSMLRVEKLTIKPIVFAAESCLVSFSAWLGTAGIIGYYFKMVSPITVLANLFIVPLATLITLSAFSLLAAAFLCPYLSLSFASANEFLVNVLLQVNAVLLRFPHAYFYLGP